VLAILTKKFWNQVKNYIKWMIRKIVKAKIFLFDGYALKSYSQEGEDMILRRIFERKKIGFYVDVGACHPKRFSNTYFFYKRGWRGINVDAMPGSMKFFQKIRARDINLEVAISNKKQELTYYMFNEPALNSFSKSLSKERDRKGEYKIYKEIKIKTFTFEEILDDYLPKDIEIDFLSIDVEGLDFQVLKSNNWCKYKPKIILIEALDFSFDKNRNSKIYRFLIDKDYHLLAKTFNTLIFINKESFNLEDLK